jgi:hypothetical protein
MFTENSEYKKCDFRKSFIFDRTGKRKQTESFEVEQWNNTL